MTKKEFFCMTPGDMILPDNEIDSPMGMGLVLSRRRLGRGRVQIVVQWQIEGASSFILKYYSDSLFSKRGSYATMYVLPHTVGERQ